MATVLAAFIALQLWQAISMNPNCYYGDHDWQGGSRCVNCDERLRCVCGRFLRADSAYAHLDVCPILSEPIRQLRERLAS